MTKNKIVIVGAGGHSHAILDILLWNDEYDIYGLIDNRESATDIYGVRLLGGDDLLTDIYTEGVHKAFVAIGDNADRERNFRLLEKIGFGFINTVSRNAYVSDRAFIDRGVAIMHGTAINAGVRIGDGAVVNTRAVVDHDSVVGEFAHIAPGAVLCGGVTVGNETFIGSGATVIQCLQVGEKSIIAAGAAVIKDVPDNAIVAGVPASVIKYKK